MKKALKITGIVIGSLILLLLILPYAFRGKIKETIITQGNKMLNARFDFGSLNLSLLRNFPNATVTLRDFALWGIDDFAADTLISAGKVTATVNLFSLLGDEGYEISKVAILNTDIKAIVLEDGRVNWDIMKPSEEPADTTVKKEEGSSDFRIKLKKFILDDINLIYDDRAGKTYASVEDLKLLCSGDMSAEQTLLRLQMEIERASVRMGGIPYLSNAKIGAKIDVDADLANKKFTLRQNSISLNAIEAGIDGTFAMLDSGYEMDLTLNTNKIGFKELLSLIPAVYAKDFSSLQAAGEVALTAWAKGTLTEETVPAFEVSLNVDKASFRYPALPKGVDNIRIAVAATNPGGSADQTVVQINPLQFSMGGNPFAATLRLASPISDPAFATTAKGTLNLGMVKEVYPLEETELNGTLKADFSLDGRLSYIEKEQYDKFKASGSLQLSDMLLKMKGMPDVDIKQSTFSFTPAYLGLSETTVNIGSSDITTDCRLENYIGYLLKGQTIKGSLNIRSNNLDLNELMGSSESIQEGATDTDEASATETGAATEPAGQAQSGVFLVPENIDFAMNTSLKKLIFSNLQLDNVAGQVNIRNGKLDMKNLSMDAVGGHIVANGSYNTAGTETPELDAALKLQELSFGEVFSTFVTVQKLAPIFQNLQGNFSGDLSLTTKLDSVMAPIYSTLNGSGALSTKNLSLSGVETIDKIADAIQKPELKNITAKDLNLSFKIDEGRIQTQPFDIKLGDTNLNLSGSTGIDQTIDYTGKITLPPSTGALSKLTTLDLTIGGTFSSPQVSVDMKGMAEQALKQVTTEAKEQALDEIGKKLGVDISDAEKQREALIDAARQAGDKLIESAQKQADELVEKAGDKALARVAAQTAGKKLVDSAKKQAEELIAKATEEGDKLVEKAQQGEQ